MTSMAHGQDYANGRQLVYVCVLQRERVQERKEKHTFSLMFFLVLTLLFSVAVMLPLFFSHLFFSSLLLILLGCFSDFFLPYQVAQASASWHKPSAWLPAQARQPADVRAVALSTKSASFSNSAPRLSVGLPGGCTVLLCQCLSVP